MSMGRIEAEVHAHDEWLLHNYDSYCCPDVANLRKHWLSVNISSTAMSQLHNSARRKHPCLSGTAEGPCDFIIWSQREPEQTSWQGDYFGIWTQLENYYAMPLGLIYCTPRNAQQISFWERDRDRPVCFCVSERSCVHMGVCVCLSNTVTQMRLLAGISAEGKQRV